MRIDVLTLFPEVFAPFVETSIIGRAQAAGLVSIHFTHIRHYAHDAHHSVDDKPFGGGPGMVLKCQPLFECVEHVLAEGRQAGSEDPRMVLLTPQGRQLTQSVVQELAGQERLLLICGHYEGFDERIRMGLGADEISIGDYVLSGGEPAAMVLIDAVVRLQPGALGDAGSAQDDSFSAGLLEYPQYTRPREFRGMAVPEVLLSGDHARIADWRRSEALRRTRARRPDLIHEQKVPT